MRVGVAGLEGGGKTLLLTIFGFLDYDVEGIEIKSNYKTTFSEYVNPVQILKLELENCTLLMDEAWSQVDSRSNSLAQRLNTYMFVQSRKSDVNVYYSSQLLGAVDLRYRDLSETKILAERLSYGFRYTLFDHMGNMEGEFIIEDEQADPFFEMYNHKDLVLPAELDSKNILPFDDILSLAERLSTKKGFTVALKGKLPYVTGEIISGVYDMIQDGEIELAKDVLNY